MTVQVLVGGDAAALAQQFLAAAQQFAATLNAVSTTAFDLANQSVWNGSTAERFRTEQQQLAGHLHTIGPSLIRTAQGALAVIQAIDRDDAAGLNAGPGGSAQTSNYTSTDYTQSPTGYPANLGAKIGNDLGQLLAGIGLMILGGGGEIAGVGLDVTGIGTAIGIPTGIVSAGVIVSGAGLALHGAQDLGQNLAAMSSARSGGSGPGSSGSSSVPSDGGLNPAEQATLGRLQKIFPDLGLRGVNLPSADFVDKMGNEYDAMGAPGASENWKSQESNFLDQIPRHVNKSGFAVIDLTGFTGDQITTVQNYVSKLPESMQQRMIIINGTNIIN